MTTFSTIPTPVTRADWEAQRPVLRERLRDLLGDVPPLFTPSVTILDRSLRDGCVVERFIFDNRAGAQVYGYFLSPPDPVAPAPAILYHHMHGNKYEVGKDELFQNWLIDGIMPGPALVRAGYCVLAIDAYCFGERQTQGPAGDAESGAATEQALFKHFVWRGSTLWGMMVRDDLLALNYLLTRPEVDPNRVGVTGMSLGGSRTTWLAALDERVQVVVPVAQMTRYRDFAATGRYNLHGIYYYLPGMLKSGIDMEHLVALAAPRPQAILIGDDDPLSPLAGIEKVAEFARHVYLRYGADDRLLMGIQPGLAHTYTPPMFEQMIRFFGQHL
jgi:dienelactone hydrolase